MQRSPTSAEWTLRDFVAAANRLVNAACACRNVTARRLRKLTGKVNAILRELKG